MSVLLACVQNACRSQMAEGLLRRAAARSHEARSAGSSRAGQQARAIRGEIAAWGDALAVDLDREASV